VIVLSQDLLTIPATDIPKSEVVLTIVGGKLVYEKK
jgi:predicted amidohydrolase YtcJ